MNKQESSLHESFVSLVLIVADMFRSGADIVWSVKRSKSNLYGLWVQGSVEELLCLERRAFDEIGESVQCVSEGPSNLYVSIIGYTTEVHERVVAELRKEGCSS